MPVYECVEGRGRGDPAGQRCVFMYCVSVSV